MDYQLDTNAAKKADVIFSKIDAKGKYMGELTRAEKVTSTKGTIGVDLSFKAAGGETADYLTLWTHNKDGKQLMGFNTLMAIMTCLRVRELKAQDGEIEKYDNDLKARVKVVVPLFKELMHKPLGLLIHMEEYAKTAGGTAWKPVIAAAFDKDEFTASEILSKAVQPVALPKMVQALRDRPLNNSTVSSPAAQSGAGNGFDDMPDDLPF